MKQWFSNVVFQCTTNAVSGVFITQDLMRSMLMDIFRLLLIAMFLRSMGVTGTSRILSRMGQNTVSNKFVNHLSLILSLAYSIAILFLLLMVAFEDNFSIYKHPDQSLMFSSSLPRISTRLILPLIVLGSSLTNSIIRGYLYGAVTFFTWFWSSFLRSSLGK